MQMVLEQVTGLLEGTLLPSTLIWGIFVRALGAVYLLAFVSLGRQVLAMSGVRGVTPVGRILAGLRRDEPSWRRMARFPTLLWLGHSDRALMGWIGAGVLGAALVLTGGALTWPGLALCWAVYLSFAVGLELRFPWDCLLLEMGFLALFMPPLAGLEVASEPHELLAWAHRWLLFRLMFGFGKNKFLGTTSKDASYLQGFFIIQPMPSPIGWLASRWPVRLHQAALFFMFAVEILVPFGLFWTGPVRVASALMIMALQVGIWLGGNFGFFNLLTLALCVPMLDASSSVFGLGWQSVAPGTALLTTVCLTVWALATVVYLPFNNWVGPTWPYWPGFSRIGSRFWRVVIGLCRVLGTWRMVHAYGIFPPYSNPPVRFVATLEGSADGQQWQEYVYSHMPSHPSSAPRFVAPHHPRTNYVIFYEALGIDSASFFASLVSAHPYGLTDLAPSQRLAQRLLEGEPSVQRFFARNPFPASGPPPRFVRSTLHMLTATTLEERRRTGHWWTRRRVGVHMPAMSRNDALWDRLTPPPEHYHWDMMWWTRRTGAPRALLGAVQNTQNPQNAAKAVLESTDTTSSELDTFWNQVVPTLQEGLLGDDGWQRIHAVVPALRAQLGQEQWARQHLAMSRLTLALYGRLEPLLETRDESQKLSAPGFFQVQLLIHAIAMDGQTTFERVFADPASATQWLKDTGMPLQRSGALLAAFWYGLMTKHAFKARLARTFIPLEAWNTLGFLPGFMSIYDELGQLLPPYPDANETLPSFQTPAAWGSWTIHEPAEIKAAPTSPNPQARP